MFVRRLLIVPLIALACWMVMAFFVVRNLSVSHRLDQLTLGSIGEPDMLNPIISQTTSASEVGAFLFNGLLKYDENLNIVGDLAEDYRLTQTSTAFFKDAASATKALSAIQTARDQWATLKIRSAEQIEKRIVLTFADPNVRVVAGTSYEDDLFKIVPRDAFVPVSVVTVFHEPNGKLADTTPANSENILAVIRNTGREVDAAQVHEAVAVTDTLISIVVLGDSKTFREKLTTAFAPPPAKEGEPPPSPAAEITEFVDQALLNEPQLRITLRKGVRWHDGREVTSRDAAFTYRCILDPKYRSPRGADYWTVKRVETPDDYTFVVTYRYPYCESLSNWMMSLIPAHILEGKSPEWWAENYNDSPIGTGPFKNVQWERNEFIRLEANENYFQGPPNLKSFVYRILPDQFVNQVAFDARGFDIKGLSPHEVQRYEADTKTFKTFSRWGLSYSYIGWNLKNPLFQDRRVRVALARAINIDQIIKYIYRGQGTAANGTFPAHEWYGNPDLKPFGYDPDKARQLLADAGWKDTDGDGILDKDGQPFKFQLITNNGNPVRAAIMVLAQSDLKKIGIQVETSTYEWAVFIKNYINSQTFDACVLGWSLGRSIDQYQLWHSSQAEPPGLNFCSYRNPEADALLLKVRTTLQRSEQARLCKRLQEVIYADQPYLFIQFPKVTTAIYRGQYVVRRPGGPDGGRIVEPIRSTEAGGVSFYMDWWAPATIAPELTP